MRRICLKGLFCPKSLECEDNMLFRLLLLEMFIGCYKGVILLGF